MNSATLPAKIKNLFLLQRLGTKVPFFIVVDRLALKNISKTVKEAIYFFEKKYIGSIIIRSALSCEDSLHRSFAGFFKSSDAIPTKTLSEKALLKYWQTNQEKAREVAKDSDLYLLLQEFIFSEYSGVLFTQNIYDADEAVLALSSHPAAITQGLPPEKCVVYDKKARCWKDSNFLSLKLKRELEEKIARIEKEFPSGAGIELGIKEEMVWMYQARPIVRSNDEEILLAEKKRLSNIFKDDFMHQLWVKNPFVETLGELSNLSVEFYNSLFCSDEFRSLLSQAGLISRKKDGPRQCRILENIGNRTYYNLNEEKNFFAGERRRCDLFAKTVRILAFEKLMKRCCLLQDSERQVSLKQAFAWLFLCSVYLQFFLEREKQKMPAEDFWERLRNTETVCKAREPRPNSLKPEEIERFRHKYYFLAERPYELTSPRLAELSMDEFKSRYAYLQGTQEMPAGSAILSKSTRFWLTQKVRWKETFLKALFDNRASLIEQCGANIYETKGKMSLSALQISGLNFPFPKDNSAKETIVVPGDININKCYILKEEDDVANHLHQYIAMSIFPVSRIHLIPLLKGLILQQGSEFSHVAIICREFGIPCRISPLFFKRQVVRTLTASQ